MEVNWNILYRGSLDSCNYDCHYCPFAKKKNTREELLYDKKCLNNFANWAEERTENLRILFTPWGEGLIRSYYQKAMIRLSHMQHVKLISIQTNLSCQLEWIKEVNPSTFRLWVTYHPDEVSFEKFIEKCQYLIANNIQFSVGVVGMKTHYKAIEKLKAILTDRYVWINAYKREVNYYSESEKTWLAEIDPYFKINNTYHDSLNKSCQAGYSSFSITGEGDVYPCHFVKQKLGNIYKNNLKDLIQKTTCPNTSCGCYIGYMNLDSLNLKEIYGNELLTRIIKS